MLTNPFQTFQSENNSDNLNVNKMVEEEGIHYNFQSLLKYPQSRARIQSIQNTENIELPKLVVHSLIPPKKLGKDTRIENSISALMQHIEKLERTISKYEHDLKFVHRRHFELGSDLSEE